MSRPTRYGGPESRLPSGPTSTARGSSPVAVEGGAPLTAQETPVAILWDDALESRLAAPDAPALPASAQGVDHLGAVLDGVSPCPSRKRYTIDTPCDSRRRIVLAFDHPVAGLYCVECSACGARSSMRPADVDALAVRRG